MFERTSAVYVSIHRPERSFNPFNFAKVRSVLAGPCCECVFSLNDQDKMFDGDTAGRYWPAISYNALSPPVLFRLCIEKEITPFSPPRCRKNGSETVRSALGCYADSPNQKRRLEPVWPPGYNGRTEM